MDSSALEPAERLNALATDEYETTIVDVSGPARSAACPSTGGCVIASSGAAPERVTAGAAVIGAIRATAPASRIIERVDAPSRVHPAAAAVLHVRTRRPAKRIEVHDGEALVGFAEPGGQTETDVTWVPLAAGARALRVTADGDETDIGVVVDATAVPLLYYEPETTWLGTFVRRALQEDERFAVRGVTRVAPAVTVSAEGPATLTLASLEGVGVVFLAAPDALTLQDVDLLERFVTQRGGSLVVIPDRQPAGPVLRLLPGIGESRRSAQPGTIGWLRAAELVAFEEGPDVTALERTEGGAIVVVKDLGRGRVIVSGALDAWRHRDAKGDFAAFWQSLARDAAAAAGESLRITTPRPLVRPGDDVPVEVEWQTMAAVPTDLTAQGSFECGSERGVLRLWPSHRPGTFAGMFRPREVGPCRLSVSVAGVSAGIPLLVAADVRHGDEPGDRLEGAIAAHGGVVVSAGHEDDLLPRIRQALTPRDEPQTTRPMRSPLWMLPLFACLGGEWWLRRRAAAP